MAGRGEGWRRGRKAASLAVAVTRKELEEDVRFGEDVWLGKGREAVNRVGLEFHVFYLSYFMLLPFKAKPQTYYGLYLPFFRQLM